MSVGLRLRWNARKTAWGEAFLRLRHLLFFPMESPFISTFSADGLRILGRNDVLWY
jgi:hypothetical protein